jgi:hypothetical protein
VRRLVNREIKETGTSEDVPRTAAITQIAGEKKAPANAWHCCAVIYLGLPSPAAELAATVGGYKVKLFAATFDRVQCKLISVEMTGGNDLEDTFNGTLNC